MQTELLTLIDERFSPRDFRDRAVEPAALRKILEAARWAPSSYNEQPWVFLVARSGEGDELQTMADCLTPANREWAADAPVLMISVARKAFARNGEANRHALHDVGLATAQMILQAEALGLAVHCMAGFDPICVRTTYSVPEGWEPVAAIAIGYPAEQEPEERTRKELGTFVFEGDWGSAADFTTDPAARADGH